MKVVAFLGHRSVSVIAAGVIVASAGMAAAVTISCVVADQSWCCTIANVTLPVSISCEGKPKSTVCSYTLWGSGNSNMQHFRDAHRDENGYRVLKAGANSNCQWFDKLRDGAGGCVTSTGSGHTVACQAFIPVPASGRCVGQ